MPKKHDLGELTPKERLFIELLIANPDLSKMQAALAAGWARGSIAKLVARKRVKQALEQALADKTARVVEKAAERVLALRAELLRSLLAGVQLDSTVINKVLDAAAGPKGAINAGVFAALLNWTMQSGKNLAEY